MDLEEPAPPGDERLTYAQLADRLGISRAAAQILVRRRGWQRIQGTHPRAPAVIVVPTEALAAEKWRQREAPPPSGNSLYRTVMRIAEIQAEHTARLDRLDELLKEILARLPPTS